MLNGNDMDFFDTVARRHSIRAFRDVEVEREKIDRILETINHAPSAGDLQAYQVYLVHSRRQRLALAHAALDQMFISEAPVVLVFCATPQRSAIKYGQRGEQLYALQDATIACAYAQLATSTLGLGAAWVGSFDEDAVRRAIGAPGDEIPIAILPVGYPAEAPGWTPRRSLRDLVREV
ncbi:MAG: nitroreductase family protein [Chloroflexi bacterium]|nr:nitroreductase family protein [Chloroflexota bacterium]